MNKLSERLKTLRKNKKLSQQEIANKLDVSRVAYTNWENGNREPNYDNLIKLSVILEASTDYLLGISDINNGSGYSKIPELVPGYIIYGLLDDLEKTKDSFTEEEYMSRKSELLKMSDAWDKFNNLGNGNNLETTHSKSDEIDDNKQQ